MTKTLIPFLLVVFCLSRTLTGLSQSTVFYDTLTSIPGHVSIESAFMNDGYLYASGGAYIDSNANALPTLYKLDTLGNTVWTSIDQTDCGRFLTGRASIAKLIKSGSQLYPILEFISYGGEQTSPPELWCISDSTGALLWKLPVKNALIMKLADYDAISLIVITMDNGQNPGPRYVRYNLVQKNRGHYFFQSNSY